MSVTAERFLNSLHYKKSLVGNRHFMAPNAVLSRSSVGAPQTRLASFCDEGMNTFTHASAGEVLSFLCVSERINFRITAF